MGVATTSLSPQAVRIESNRRKAHTAVACNQASSELECGKYTAGVLLYLILSTAQQRNANQHSAVYQDQAHLDAVKLGFVKLLFCTAERRVCLLQLLSHRLSLGFEFRQLLLHTSELKRLGGGVRQNGMQVCE